MTWRAFLLGLVLVVIMSWADVSGGLSRGYGWTTEGHFPEACVFLLVLVTLVLNVLIKLVKRAAALRHAELMLIWCMLIVAATVPTTGLMRFWFPMLAGPSYIAQRSDIHWRDTALEAAPDTLLLTKNPKSVAAKQFFEGGRTEGALPWKQWLVPMSRWFLFLASFNLAVIFLCGILRKQWVDRERLQFPLARVPLEFTEGSAGPGLLPRIFSNRAFIIGLVGTTAFRMVRALPVLIGAETPWAIAIPMQDVLQGTPLEQTHMVNFELWWMPIGFAYLVPADVSLSVWFFYLLGRAELQTAAWLGSPLHYGGTWSPLMLWQQAGAYMAFTAGALWMCRRHFRDVIRKAVGRGRDVDDSAEPVSHGLSFWGFAVFSGLSLAWFAWYGMRPITTVAFFLILMCAQLVHARIVSQSGLYATWLLWDPPNTLHALSGGHAFGAAGAVLAHMQHRIMMHNVTLAPATMHCFRISEVFNRFRRLLLPALLVAFMAAMVVSSWTYLNEAYSRGGLNFNTTWATTGNPKQAFDLAHQKIQAPWQVSQVRWLPFLLGIVMTGFVMIMRARFYWWPVHSIGLLTISNWYADRMWLPFLLGWLTKICLLKFVSGRLVRQARFFFIGLILAESSIKVVSTITGMLTGGAVPRF